VRQLKNVAMQISLIEERREISAEVLSHYLPAHQMNRGLAIVNQQAQQEIPMEDLKMLYNVVAILKHKVDVLESQMQQMPRYTDEVVPYNPVTTSSVSSSEGGDKIPDEPEEVDSLVEVKMTDVQKETIRKSLIRNRGNRKATADELGISERTLYRKIKAYNL
jgi:DNA-binding NtrC family response regulator